MLYSWLNYWCLDSLWNKQKSLGAKSDKSERRNTQVILFIGYATLNHAYQQSCVAQGMDEICLGQTSTQSGLEKSMI